MELPRSKILVVDDDPFLQKLARMQLEKLNMHITLAGSASQVYEFFRSGYLPDLVLMDCHMPEKDGYTLTRELREMQSMHLVPIIAVTAGAMKGDKERCLAAGMNDYLSKPYTLKQLSEVLRRCLPSATKTDDDISNLNPYQNLKPDSVMVDLKRLKQSYGEDAISEILATFFQSAPPLVRQLEECSLKRNAEEIKFLAHRLKGASSMACIDKIAASSKVLEISASEANWREIDTQISLLKVLILKARELYRQ